MPASSSILGGFLIPESMTPGMVNLLINLIYSSGILITEPLSLKYLFISPIIVGVANL